MTAWKTRVIEDKVKDLNLFVATRYSSGVDKFKAFGGWAGEVRLACSVKLKVHRDLK